MGIRFAVCFTLSLSLLLSGCFLDHPIPSYYGVVKPPADQEFRWSDGGLPKVFDPSLAAAPPDTDAVRALYEGLTDYDPQTLRPTPAVAERWEASADNQVWTFYLRRDARWSNGDPVTAQDFVRSWKRAVEPQRHAPHAKLLANINGVDDLTRVAATTAPAAPAPNGTPAPAVQNNEQTVPSPSPTPGFGAEAVSEYVLRVRLEQPDVDFPSLVAHPAFRPSHETNTTATQPVSADTLITNGAFRIAKVTADNVLLERAPLFWDAGAIELKSVRFVDSVNTEGALAAYRAGDVDAVTNVGFEPLAIKLLSPYKDFRRYTFGSLNYYRFNTTRAPFNDVRVRQALAIAFDRDRLIEDETKGVSEPATSFLPVQITGAAGAPELDTSRLKFDITRARELLAEAGYPNGQGFPRVRLLINRNEQQRQVAQAIVAMWRTSLGIDAEIVIKSWDEYEAAMVAGDYDIVRRGMVMQTTNEAANMFALVDPGADLTPGTDQNVVDPSAPTATPNTDATPLPAGPATSSRAAGNTPPITTQAQALANVPAIPLYFASSYSMVKPYMIGFDANLLDAPSLKRVRVDTAWQPSPR
jgi:oligopeptide transport system substrate-binding protein